MSVDTIMDDLTIDDIRYRAGIRMEVVFYTLDDSENILAWQMLQKKVNGPFIANNEA